MNTNLYQKDALRTAENGHSFTEKLAERALGLTGEAGEVADIIKKHLEQGHPLDVQKVKEELGDVCWYIATLAALLGIDFEDILYTNVDKLMKRYPEGFTVEASLNRKDG